MKLSGEEASLFLVRYTYTASGAGNNTTSVYTLLRRENRRVDE